MWIGFFAALTNSLLGDSISYIFYSANTTIPQVDNAVQGIFVATKNLTFAAYFGGTVTQTLLIKLLVQHFVCFCIELQGKLKNKFCKRNFYGK